MVAFYLSKTITAAIAVIFLTKKLYKKCIDLSPKHHYNNNQKDTIKIKQKPTNRAEHATISKEGAAP